MLTVNKVIAFFCRLEVQYVIITFAKIFLNE